MTAGSEYAAKREQQGLVGGVANTAGKTDA